MLDLVCIGNVLTPQRRQGPPILNLLDPAQTDPHALANLLQIPCVADVLRREVEWTPTHPLLSYSFARSPVLRRVVRVAGAIRRDFRSMCFAHGSSGVEVECPTGLVFRHFPGSLRDPVPRGCGGVEESRNSCGAQN